MKQLLHTPEGVRDIYGLECKKKKTIQNKLHKTFHLYGYQDVQTPLFEYFDVFRKEIGTISSKELYKLFDREGDTLVLRPDFTPSIARVAATLLRPEELPIRLSYNGNTLINHSSYQGHLKENTQMGAEHIGVDSVESDAEMIVLAVHSLQEAGLTEFQISVGHVDFFLELLDEIALPEEDELYLRELIANRNFFGVEELLDNLHVPKKIKDKFSGLSELTGGVEILKKARTFAANKKAQCAIDRLEDIYNMLRVYDVTEYVSFDLSMAGLYGYYTGVIFRGYTFGTGDAIVKGGRYDHLVEKFGKQFPAIGFAVTIDDIMKALSRQKIDMYISYDNTLILYDEMCTRDAIKLAKEFRSKGRCTELLHRDENRSLEDYSSLGRAHLAGSIVYLKDTSKIIMINILTGERKLIEGRIE